MPTDEQRRHSRWMMRVMEWNDSRARYPNLWHDEMPRNVLARDGTVSRLRLGDLIAVYYPTNPARPRRSERFVGLARVTGLRLADEPGYGWIDLETAHRFDPPLTLEQQPRRVFLCCDPGWPDADVRLFREVFDAAMAAGWAPHEEDAEPVETAQAPPPERPTLVVQQKKVAPTPPPEAATAASVEVTVEPGPPAPQARSFAGVDYSGDMRDPKDGTWLAILELHDRDLRVTRLAPTGRHGLEGFLRDPDTMLMRAEAIGLDFPFGLPLAFAEKLMGRPFPAEGWWALAKRMEKLSRPDYLVAIQEFRDDKGETKRYTDEVVDAFSPLHRVNPDLGPMTYHGIRMIAEDRSRYSVKPFESAIGRYLLEVYPGGFVKRLRLGGGASGDDGRNRRPVLVEKLARLESLPVRMDERASRACLERRDALDAVIAARLAAVAVLTGEVARSPEELAPGEGERVRREGWIYGLAESA